MMPDIEREERRKKRAPVIAFILFGSLVVSALVQLLEPGWQWVPIAVGVAAITAVGVTIDPPGGRGRGSGSTGREHRMGSGRSGRGRDDDGGPAGAAAPQWHLLAIVSRLMPGPAGRRWLAEAESLLSEIAPVRRGAAIRSYLLSAPGLAVMMWAREARRRARLGPRRPG
jgi:hypothetical protein